jgi:hypothetical protein
MNEKYGIVTTMNLLLSSEINSLEIGYLTETQQEYKELFHYYQRYICKSVSVYNDTIASEPPADLREMMQIIREGLKKAGKNSWLWFVENALHISTGRNNYRVLINDGLLRITARLRTGPGADQQSDLCSTLISKKVGELSIMKADIHADHQSYILQLSGQAQYTLKSTCISGLQETEAAYMIKWVVRFINTTDDLVCNEAFISS